MIFLELGLNYSTQSGGTGLDQVGSEGTDAELAGQRWPALRALTIRGHLRTSAVEQGSNPEL